MPSYREVLHQAQKELAACNAYEQHAQLLLLELANQELADLYLCFEEEMPEELQERFLAGVERLKKQEPLQYILGYSWFYGRKFHVGPDVLIPRYETEELVANVLADYDEYFAGQKVEVADVGTGSGAIAISLACEEPNMNVIASDISDTALEVAKNNANDLGVQVSFVQGDMLEPIVQTGKKLDILVSNPPYIPKNQEMETSVVDFEPNVALFGGDDGLFFYRKIFQNAEKVLKEKAFLAFEIGYDEKESILKLANEYFPDDPKEVLQDLNGKDRMLFIYRNCKES